MDPSEVKIFLSSTFIDLKDIRTKVIKWLGEVFEARLVVMETFGSDAAPPNIISARRVRECDLFVGIYAHRYGSIDASSGKSITELELDEANESFSSGSLRDILLYVLPDNESWLSEFREATPEAITGQQRLRGKVASHSYTGFRTTDELLFAVVRDVRRKLDEHFREFPQTLRPFIVPNRRKIERPVGMEYITSEFQEYLISREEKVNELVALARKNSTVLLLGESGTGKTSVLHAGLIPKVIDLDWRPVFCRPFGLPSSDIVQQIQSSLFGGVRSHRSDLLAVVAEAIAALNGRMLVVIIDQFEDVLAARNIEDVRALISNLSVLRQFGNPCLRVIISYRADLEARLGEYWQVMSGSASGLPRVYVAGLAPQELWSRIQSEASDLNISLKIREAESVQIVKDLVTAGLSIGVEGVYPPHVQMFIDHLWKFSTITKADFTMDEYRRIGGVQGIIGNYLSRQLDYAHDVEGNLRSVLVSLVRSYGVKATKELLEIQSDTGLDIGKCESALEKLIDLRLVRHVENYYEITHDFVARKVMAELVGSEEKEFKRFRELLSSKAAAYRTTQNPLTEEELLMIYKHRQRIIPTPEELQLLLIAFIQGTGPTLYWLLNVPRQEILALLAAEEVRQQLTLEQQANVLLLKRKLDVKLLLDADFSCFRAYQRSWELAGLIATESLSLPVDVLSFGLKHRREEVREAALLAVVERIKHGELMWLPQLRRSGSLASFRAYLRLTVRKDIPVISNSANTRVLVEFSMLQRLKRTRSAAQAQQYWQRIAQVRMPNRVRLFGEASVLAKSGDLTTLMELCDGLSNDEATVALEAIATPVSIPEMLLLLNKLRSWIEALPGHTERPTDYAKATALADAILRVSERRHLPQLRQFVKSTMLLPPMRPIVLALVTYGFLRDFKILLQKIARADERVEFWNHIQLGYSVAKLMERASIGIPKFLNDMILRREFWQYVRPEDRSKSSRKDLLPIKDFLNRGLFVRLVGYGIIGSATMSDSDVLVRLSGHSYGFLARAAATRLAELLHNDVLNLLTKVIETRVQQGNVESFANALRFAEMRVFDVI